MAEGLYTRVQRSTRGNLAAAGVTKENWRVWDAAKLLADRAAALFAGMVRLPALQPGCMIGPEPHPPLTTWLHIGVSRGAASETRAVEGGMHVLPLRLRC